MHASSRSIVTNQPGPHEDLSRRVARALAHPLRKPVAEHTRTAFEAASEWLEARPGMPLVLDAGCGVGLSTRRLAVRFPDHAVIGVDRSESRLSREHGSLPTMPCWCAPTWSTSGAWRWPPAGGRHAT